MMNIPNLITLARLLSVPLMLWLMLNALWFAALFVFVILAISDVLDGFLARLWNNQTVLGAYLDPMADKLLLVSVFLVFGVKNLVPLWLVIILVGRDILIIGGVILAHVLANPLIIRAHWISKVNTAIQFCLAIIVFISTHKTTPDFFDSLIKTISWLAALSITLSTVAYLRLFFYHTSHANHDQE